MSNTMSKTLLIGRLGGTPKPIEGKDGEIIGCNMSIATNESIPDGDGGWKEVTEWHNVTVWAGKSKLVEKLILPYVEKGHMVYVEGKNKTRRVEKDGVTHYNTGVVVRPGGFAHLTSKKESAAMAAEVGGGDGGGDDDGAPF